MYRGKRIGNVFATAWTGAPTTEDLDAVIRDAKNGYSIAGPLVCLTILTEQTEVPSPGIILQMIARQKELSSYQRSAHFVYIRESASSLSHTLRSNRFRSYVTQFILAGGGSKLDDANSRVLDALEKALKQGPLTFPPEEILRQLKADGFPVG
jgi:hypothetical protein